MQSGLVAALVRDFNLHTVCEEARCPNLNECWTSGTATFMILGSACTRRCGFCAVVTARPVAPDPEEPGHVAEAAARLQLSHVVITSVARDDLPDQGAGHFVQCIRAVRARLPSASVEVLTPDFRGDERCLATILEAQPDVFNHNLETVERLSLRVRPQARYRRSLALLARVRQMVDGILSKSGMMLGLGESPAELDAALSDLAGVGCQLLTLGQYLQPTLSHLPVDRFVPPAEFERWQRRALQLGFLHVASSPFTRSSHHAGEALTEARRKLQPA